MVGYISCIGLKFWKAPNRKIFAVEEDDLVRDVAGPSTGSARKRRRMEQLAPELYIDDALAPLTEKVEMLVRDMDGIKGQLKEVFVVTKDTKVPLALKRSINATFACKICRGVITPPVIFSRCCQSILGCVACIDQWYGGSDGLMKNCPNCSTERGYAETVRMAGMDDFLESIRPLYDSDTEARL